MRYFTKFFMVLLPLIFLISCGGNPLENGDKAYAEGKYKEAIGFYKEAQKASPDDVTLLEKIALSYMQQGFDLFKRRKNIKSFEGNYNKAMGLLEEDIQTPELTKDYSNLLYELANAYNSTKPKNDIQKKLYLNKTLEYLEVAVEFDEANQKASELLAQVKADNFQGMFNKGLGYYNRAKKTKVSDDYLLAEFYLAKAASFNPEDKEAEKYLKLTRKKTLSIPDFDTVFPLAIAGIQQKGKFTTIDFTVFNYTNETSTINPENFKLIDKDGTSYSFDSEQTDKFEGGLTKSIEVKTAKRLDAILSFPASKSVSLDYFSYDDGKGNIVKKYLP